MKLPRPTRAPAHLRPYWHVDAKWISGLLLLATLGTSLLLSVAAALTSPSRGVEVAATIIATAFSPDGLDAPVDTTALRARFAAEHTDRIAPIEAFPTATITLDDLSLPPRELRLKIFRQFAQPIYDQGVAGAAATFSNDPAQQQKFQHEAFALTIFTHQTHTTLQTLVWVGLGLAGGLLAAVVYFSWGWGRLANPGLLLLLAGLPGTILWAAISHPGPDGTGQPLGFIPATLTPDVLTSLQDSYVLALVAGLVLLFAAGLGKLIRHHHPS